MYLSDGRKTNISKSCTHKMAAKTSWHRYGTKVRHCHRSLCKRQWVTYVLGQQQRRSASARGRGNTVGLTAIFHWKISHFNYRTPSAGASGGLAPYRKIALPLGDCTGRPITGPSYAWVVHELGWPVGWVGSRFFSFWWVGLGPL